jgi:hypothetical protein
VTQLKWTTGEEADPAAEIDDRFTMVRRAMEPLTHADHLTTTAINHAGLIVVSTVETTCILRISASRFDRLSFRCPAITLIIHWGSAICDNMREISTSYSTKCSKFQPQNRQPTTFRQTTEESLRDFFKVLGEVSNASVVREPQTQSSRYVI